MNILIDDENLKFSVEEDFDVMWTCKGYYFGSILKHAGQIYRISFFDPVRFSQDCESMLQLDPIFTEKNIVIIPEVNLERMQNAARWLVDHREIDNLRYE